MIADRPEAGGLARAAALGVPTAVVPVKRIRGPQPPSSRRCTARSRRAARRWWRWRASCASSRRSSSPQLEGRLLNIHPSLLPDYKGLDTHARVLAAREAVHGASVHYVTPELDGGPVIMQGRLRVRAGDTAETISARVHALEHIIYPHVCSLIAAGRVEWRQGTVYVDGKPLATPLIEENDAAA